MAAHLPKEKIIVAEDSAPNRKILTHLLTKLGYQVIDCEDGETAWNALNAHAQEAVCVITDIMMPKMDGIDLLKNIRNSPKFEKLPVLLITAVSDKDYIAEAKNMQVNGYILKPVTFQRVTQKLQELFPQKVFPKMTA